MTKDEFWQCYKVLNKKYPEKYPLQDPANQLLFFNMVKDLDVRWFNRVIARAVLMNNPKFDFLAAAAGELRSRRETIKTEKLVNSEINISNDYLERHLKNLGVNSLVETLKK